jgi:hypothetical protein
MDETWFKRSLLRPINEFVKQLTLGWRDKSAQKLAMDMVALILPNYPVSPSKFLYEGEDELTKNLNYFIRSLYDNIRSNMNPTLVEVISSTPYSRDYTLAAPFAIGSMDRLKK